MSLVIQNIKSGHNTVVKVYEGRISISIRCNHSFQRTFSDGGGRVLAILKVAGETSVILHHAVMVCAAGSDGRRVQYADVLHRLRGPSSSRSPERSRNGLCGNVLI